MAKQTQKSDVYNQGSLPKENHRHILTCLVDNEFGVLARVVGLFSGRGYNIESLTVAEIDEDENISRITIVTTASDMIIEQIKSLLERLIPVHKVVDITVEGDHIEREMALVKVKSNPKKQQDILAAANKYQARVVDSSAESFMFVVTDTPVRIDRFIESLKGFGVIETCRTGSIALGCGKDGIKAY